MNTRVESAVSSVPKPSPERASVRMPSRDAVLTIALPIMAVALLLFLWDWSVVRFEVPATLVPTPGAALDALWTGLRSGVLFVHLGVTLQEVLYGFLIGAALGFALGAAIAEWVLVRRALFPIVVGIQMMPKVAVAPLFIIWLGYGIESKIAITASMTFFPVLINTVAGLRSVDGETLEMMRAFRFTTLQAFHRVKLRFALPYIFVGLKVAIVLSVIGAVVAEFVGANQGLGYLILQATYQMETDKMFAVLAILAIVGIGLNGALSLVARSVLFWHDSERHSGH